MAATALDVVNIMAADAATDAMILSGSFSCCAAAAMAMDFAANQQTTGSPHDEGSFLISFSFS